MSDSRASGISKIAHIWLSGQEGLPVRSGLVRQSRQGASTTADGPTALVACLTGHLGPRAGPAVETYARLLTQAGLEVQVLYGPAEAACLRRFSGGLATAERSSGQGQEDVSASLVPSGPGGWRGRHRVVLLPDWVFDADVWPAGRPVRRLCLAFEPGPEGLMAAYCALKKFVKRFGLPQWAGCFAYGCTDPGEVAWGYSRLREMADRFLHLALTLEAADGLQQSPAPVTLLKIAEGGSGNGEAVRDLVGRLLEADAVEAARDGDSTAVAVTRLVPVERVPSHAAEVLDALGQYIAPGAKVDPAERSRHLAAGILGTEAFRAVVVAALDSATGALEAALKVAQQVGPSAAEMPTVVVAAQRLPAWMVAASEHMPGDWQWLRWRAFQLDGRTGLSFEPVGGAADD